MPEKSNTGTWCGKIYPYSCIIKIDSQAAIFIVKNVTTSERRKHIDIRHNFCLDYIEQNVAV